MVDMVEGMIVKLANNESRPDYISISTRSNPFNAAGSIPSFGCIPNLGFSGVGYQVKNVVPGSAADKAGLQQGDVLIQYGGQKIDTVVDFIKLLKVSKVNELVDLHLLRDNQAGTDSDKTGNSPITGVCRYNRNRYHIQLKEFREQVRNLPASPFCELDFYCGKLRNESPEGDKVK